MPGTDAIGMNVFPLEHATPLHGQRNAGMALNLDWVASVQANTSAIERRVATLGGRRTVKKDYQAAWLLKAITLIDLTTLAGDDTPGRVQRLCAKARQPVDPEILGGFKLNVDDYQIDASVQTKLKELERGFSRNTYISDL